MQKLVFALTVACLLAPASTHAQKAYVTNSLDNTVSVIDTTTNKVSATIPVGDRPSGVAVSPDGSKVYVANGLFVPGAVSVINAATNTVSATIPVGDFQSFGVAVTPDGSKVYVATADPSGGIVSVINTVSDTVSKIPVDGQPHGVAVTPAQAAHALAHHCR